MGLTRPLLNVYDLKIPKNAFKWKRSRYTDLHSLFFPAFFFFLILVFLSDDG